MHVHAWCILGLTRPNLVTYPLYFPHAHTHWSHPEDVCHSKGSMCTHMPTASLSNRANSSERGSVLFGRSRTNSSVLFARDRANSFMLFTRDRANSNCLNCINHCALSRCWKPPEVSTGNETGKNQKIQIIQSSQQAMK